MSRDKLQTAAVPPRLMRAYYDCRYGQLHVHNAIPAGGGFDELTAVICVHGAGQTGRAFAAAMAALGARRSVFAIDLPGNGESDAASAIDAVTAGSHAVADFVTSMRLRSFDLLALAEGCLLVPAVLQVCSTNVRRVALLRGQVAGLPAAVKPVTLPEDALQSPAGIMRLVAMLDAPT